MMLAEATDLVGYAPYLARCPQRAGQTRHASDNREELNRARAALRLAVAGAHVAVVSGGDPGVFAMAAAIFEAIDRGEPGWRGDRRARFARHIGDAGGSGAARRAIGP